MTNPTNNKSERNRQTWIRKKASRLLDAIRGNPHEHKAYASRDQLEGIVKGTQEQLADYGSRLGAGEILFELHERELENHGERLRAGEILFELHERELENHGERLRAGEILFDLHDGKIYSLQKKADAQDRRIRRRGGDVRDLTGKVTDLSARVDYQGQMLNVQDRRIRRRGGDVRRLTGDVTDLSARLETNANETNTLIGDVKGRVGTIGLVVQRYNTILREARREVQDLRDRVYVVEQLRAPDAPILQTYTPAVQRGSNVRDQVHYGGIDKEVVGGAAIIGGAIAGIALLASGAFGGCSVPNLPGGSNDSAFTYRLASANFTQGIEKVVGQDLSNVRYIDLDDKENRLTLNYDGSRVEVSLGERPLDRMIEGIKSQTNKLSYNLSYNALQDMDKKGDLQGLAEIIAGKTPGDMATNYSVKLIRINPDGTDGEIISSNVQSEAIYDLLKYARVVSAGEPGTKALGFAISDSDNAFRTVFADSIELGAQRKLFEAYLSLAGDR